MDSFCKCATILNLGLWILGAYFVPHSEGLSPSRYRRQSGPYYAALYQPRSPAYSGSSYQNRVNYKVRTSGTYNQNTDNYPDTSGYYDSGRVNVEYDNAPNDYRNTGSSPQRTRNTTFNLGDYFPYTRRNFTNSGNYNQRLTYGSNTYGQSYSRSSSNYSPSNYAQSGSKDKYRNVKYTRNDYSFRLSDDYGSRNYGYTDYTNTTCPKCPDCPPSCNASVIPPPTNSTIQDFQQLPDLCDPTLINECTTPSLPFRCTTEQCIATGEAGLGVQIFAPGEVSVSQCIFRKYVGAVLYSYNVCQVGSETQVDLTPDYVQNIDCSETADPECLWAAAGSITVRDPLLCSNLWSVSEPVVLYCILYLWNHDNGQTNVLATANINITVNPDCRC
ncbi:uncharacterized protein LOC129589882 [Paramacrobiotus metropolitanus]|uniref:uncharacterized protein LOC129589882 n=1 Tax=Paramacrobiotus metropolitanus TaxID=2943436 RepID=UPI002445BCBE|nr:uncharacterized protein LOC129589882 [Paramacrobiotus metropolitanus]